MTTLLCRKHFGALRPADGNAEEALRKLPADQTVRVEVRRMRNPRQHRLYWSLIGLVYEHQTRYATRDQLHQAIKVAVGYYDEIPKRDGQVIAVPHSIAFGNMAQDQFEEFFDSVVRLVCTKIMPGTNDSELRRELEEMVGVNA